MQVVQFLVERQADINIKDRWGGYPLKEAVSNGHTEVRDFLVENGAVLEPKDEEELRRLEAKATAKGSSLTSLRLAAASDAH